MIAFARMPAGEEGRAERLLREGGAKMAGALVFAPLNTAFVFLSDPPVEPVELGAGACLVAVTPEGRVPMARLEAGFAPPPRQGADAPCARLAEVAAGRPGFGLLVARVRGVYEGAAAGHEEGLRTLARSLELVRGTQAFAMGYGSSLAVQDDAVHVVHADADSLTAVAPWDHLPRLALALRDAFLRYSGGNAAAGLSVSVTFGRRGSSLGALFTEAHRALERATHAGGAEGRGDALHLLGAELTWPEATIASELVQTLRALPSAPRQRIETLLLHLGRASALSPGSRASRGGGVLRHARGVWRTLRALEFMSSEPAVAVPGAARPELQKLTAALRTGQWDGRHTELPMEFISSVAAQWCRRLHEDGGMS